MKPVKEHLHICTARNVKFGRKVRSAAVDDLGRGALFERLVVNAAILDHAAYILPFREDMIAST